MPSAPSSAQRSLKMLRCNKRLRHSRGPFLALQGTPARQSSLRPAPCRSPPLLPHCGAPRPRRHYSRPIFTKTSPRHLLALQPRHSGAVTVRSAASLPCIQSRSPIFLRVQRSSLPPCKRISTHRSTPIVPPIASDLRHSGRQESPHLSTRLQTQIRSP